jgi:hypothetical protein
MFLLWEIMASMHVYEFLSWLPFYLVDAPMLEIEITTLDGRVTRDILKEVDDKRNMLCFYHHAPCAFDLIKKIKVVRGFTVSPASKMLFRKKKRILKIKLPKAPSLPVSFVAITHAARLKL